MSADHKPDLLDAVEQMLGVPGVMRVGHTVAEEWLTYKAAVFPNVPIPIKVEASLKDAFHAGAAAATTLLMSKRQTPVTLMLELHERLIAKEREDV